MNRSDLSPRARRITSAILYLVIAAHFSLTWISQLPISIVGIRFGDAANSYSFLFFRQRWTLFAPDPPAYDTTFNFKCSDGDNESTWLQLDEMHFGWDYLDRMNTAGVAALLGVEDPYRDFILRLARQDATDTSPQLIAWLRARTRQQAANHRIAYRLAVELCAHVGWKKATSVRPRVTITPIVPYSERNDEQHRTEIHTYTFPWRNTENIDNPLDITDEELDAIISALIKPPEQEGS